MSEDLSQIIEDQITDAEMPSEPVSEAPTDSTPTEPVEVAPEASTAPTEPTTEQAKAVDDFEKKYGIPAQTSSGRENRIPYSRVKKITEKGVSDAKSAWTKELETSHVPVSKYKEIEAKVTDYEGRLRTVAEFERVLANDPAQFLTMLYRVPAYAQYLAPLFEQQQQTQQIQQQQQPQVDNDPRPEPDQTLPDGSKVYSMDGLDKLNEWNQRKAEQRAYARVMKEIEQQYGPIRQSYTQYQATQQQYAAALPQVQHQISEARKWPQFNENEADITKALQDHQDWNLERAYQETVWPKMLAEQNRLANEAKVNRDKVRQELLAEIKQAPRATSTGVTQFKPSTSVNAETGNMEDVIKGALRAKGLL